MPFFRARLHLDTPIYRNFAQKTVNLLFAIATRTYNPNPQGPKGLVVTILYDEQATAREQNMGFGQ
jgi:hypothetical protein